MTEQRAAPTIALTLSSHAAANKVAQYRTALARQGAAVCEVRPNTPQPIEAFHGLLLSGGGDIAPEREAYQSPPDPCRLQSVCPARDELEFGLCQAALDHAVPVLGICRGAQVLGVALGGTLVWDIDTELRDVEPHRTPDASGDAWHSLKIASDSFLRRILRVGSLRVNSSHHQANSSLGAGVRAVAWSKDGMIEAIEEESERFVLGVQWHPERMLDEDPRQARLFEVFVDAARAYAHSMLPPAGRRTT